VIQHSNAKSNTTRMYSQPGRRKKLQVIQSRRPKILLKQNSATMYKYIISVATQKTTVQTT